MIDKSLFKLKGARDIMAAITLMTLVQAALIIGQALSLSGIVEGFFQGESVIFRTPSLWIFLILFLCAHIVRTAQDGIVDRYARKRACELNAELLDVAFSDRSAIAGRLGTAGLTTTALEGLDQVETYVRVVLPKIIGLVAASLPILIAVFALDWISGIILAVMFPVIVLFMVLIGKSAAEKAQAQYARYQAMANHFIDTLRGMGTLKALGASTRAGDDVYDSSERFRKATNETLSVATLSSAILDLIGTLGVAAVAMMLAFRLLDGTLALATAIAALYLAPEYFKPIRAFASDYHASQDGKNALASIASVLSEAKSSAQGAQASNLSEWTASSTLQVSHAAFTYPDATEPAFEHVSFTATGFQKIAFIGPSGAGKSTLASVLAGFLPLTEGEIVIDGVSTSNLGTRSWRDQVIYIPQTPYLFSATLKRNIAFYTPDATDEDIMRAVEAVGLGELVASLPDGLDTHVGQGGRGLSGGERHRVALARAFLDRSRRILIFDEPTAHLDIQTELELKEQMLALMEGRLVLFATHRMHWLDSMDLVVDLSRPAAQNDMIGSESDASNCIRAAEGGEAHE